MPTPGSSMLSEPNDYIPLLPLKSGILYPGVGMPFVVGRDGSLAAVEAAMAREEKDLVVCAQRIPEGDPRNIADLYRIGVRGQVRTVQRTPQAVTVIVQGIERVLVESILVDQHLVTARVHRVPMIVDE